MPFLVMEQSVTLEALQVIVEDCPLRTRCGAAEMLSDGGGGVITVTVAFARAEVPPAPVQVIRYVEVVAGLTLVLPEVAPPVLKPPAEEQEVAPVELQVRVENCPTLIVAGEAVREAVTVELPAAQEFEF